MRTTFRRRTSPSTFCHVENLRVELLEVRLELLQHRDRRRRRTARRQAAARVRMLDVAVQRVEHLVLRLAGRAALPVHWRAVTRQAEPPLRRFDARRQRRDVTLSRARRVQGTRFKSRDRLKHCLRLILKLLRILHQEEIALLEVREHSEQLLRLCEVRRYAMLRSERQAATRRLVDRRCSPLLHFLSLLLTLLRRRRSA